MKRAAILIAGILLAGLAPGGALAVTFNAVDDLRVSGVTGTVSAPDLEVKGFSVFGSTNVLTHISTAPGNVVINGALQVSSYVYVTGKSTFTGAAYFTAPITAGAVRGLNAPPAGDAAASKAYVDGVPDTCALGSATTDDIAPGRSADIDCDGTAEAGTMTAQTLSAANDTVNAGYYNATTLAAVDADLAAGNIKSGVTIFGKLGTKATAPSAPTAGGTWLLVPGDSALGTLDFYVQKYEAKNVSGVATSQPAGTPWVSVTQWGAKTACEALGQGYHLLTPRETLTISRNIENNAWNWTGGSVGSGGLWRGHTDASPANSLAADVTGDPDDDPYVGTGNVSPSIEKRVHQLSSGQYLWDWSGNVWEWVDMTCTAGTGAGRWYYFAGYIAWTDVNLSDYEKPRAGPAGAYTSAQNAGSYYGCYATGNVVLRGDSWLAGTDGGVYTFNATGLPSAAHTSKGFRCAR